MESGRKKCSSRKSVGKWELKLQRNTNAYPVTMAKLERQAMLSASEDME